MRIGVIGSGRMGAGFGKALAAKGHQVMFSYSRDPRKLEELAAASQGATTGSVHEAAVFGEVLFLSVWLPQLEEVLAAAGPLDGKVLLSCVSGLQPDFAGDRVGIPTELKESVAETIQRHAKGAQVVEAFNITFAEILDAPSRDFGGLRPSVLYCGDDWGAKAVAARLIDECGYEGIDAGGIRVARSIETLATAWVQLAVVANLFPGVALHLLRR